MNETNNKWNDNEPETVYKRFEPSKPYKKNPQITETPIYKTKTEGGWKPQRYDVNTEDGLKQQCVKTAQGHLNKMTNQTFPKLADKYLEVAQTKFNEKEITGLNKLLIDQIFEQALLQPAFCDLYSLLCVKLDGSIKTFKRELLGKCQEEFQKDNQIVVHSSEEDEYKAKKRTLGNIKFISELFKNKMLVNPIIHVCIKRLLQNKNGLDEEQLELLCKLLLNVGSMIDDDKSKTIMDSYFMEMEELSQKVSFRIRFMIIDVIDIRKNNWKSLH